ncbi:hypothetical protein QSJ19_20560 [Gordonia sp. ABSL11-1]|uniref:hypothetical protein n=1 Tax=Gordonia sp. ABSL11-1 TaxID=3053924 RepID=UPI002573F1E6|nr:hypothetical protein [Gordonia sp. ABSL11-1]MDL9947929.1 hypothetical protein [Gordonia sp. ABSL11-1]
MDGIDEEFAEIIGLVGERRAQMIVVAAAAVAGDIRADADQLGTAHVENAEATLAAGSVAALSDDNGNGSLPL